MPKKVRCCFCSNEKDGLCRVKKVKVKANKPRLCKGFIFDEAKVKAKEPVRVIRMPYTMKTSTNAQRTAAALAPTGNAKHPLTGDLSRFTTTAGKKED